MPETPPANKQQALTIAGVDLRQDAEGRYCLNDLHKAAGGEKRHQPSNWLAGNDVQRFVQELSTPEFQGVVTKNGGNERGTYASKFAVYKYAGWISSTFEVHVYDTFDKVVTGQIQPKAPDWNDAATLRHHLIEYTQQVETLQLEKKEVEVERDKQRKDATYLRNRRAEAAPLASIGVQVVRNEYTSLPEWCDNNGLSKHRVYRFLRERNMLDSVGRPTDEARKNGCFVKTPKVKCHDERGTQSNWFNVYLTEKGKRAMNHYLHSGAFAAMYKGVVKNSLRRFANPSNWKLNKRIEGTETVLLAERVAGKGKKSPILIYTGSGFGAAQVATRWMELNSTQPAKEFGE